MSEPVLDPKALERLRRIGGERLLQAMLGSFLENAATRVAAATAAAAVGDATGVSDAAHALKSSAANVGATTLQLSAQRVERVAQERGADLHALARELETEFADARVAVLEARSHAD